MSTSRAEAFSNGVFAIAITLLVLDIDVPAPGSGRLTLAICGLIAVFYALPLPARPSASAQIPSPRTTSC